MAVSKFLKPVFIDRTYQAVKISDLDDAIYTGIYIYDTNVSNAPSNWGTCLTISNAIHGGNWIWQLAFPTGGVHSLYLRESVNGAAFTAWKTITAT